MARFFLLLALNVVFASSLHVATVDCPFGYGTNCGGGGKLSSATKAEVGAILEGILKNLSAHKSLVESKKSVQKVTSVEGAEPVLAAPVKAAMQSLVSTMRSNSQKAAADIVDSAVGLTNGQPDWVTIHGLLGSAVYGGRVDNAQDERLLHTYLQQYFSSSMLSPGSARGSIRLAPGVSLPASNVHADYLTLISNLPSQDSPDLFGLPANSDVAVQQRSASYVQQSLAQLGTDHDASTNFDRDKWAQQLTPILTL